ncbi:MAG: stress response translation initiation inhibitor YciH [Thermoanaerobaculia bacterium]|nr:stress response translation initiation inhibitor YciH [Thermoanaerobaculia bacterium]
MASRPSDRGTRPVYATGRGRLCPVCGWPADHCRCSARLDEPLPERIEAVLRLERAGRGGKTVTVVAGLPQNRPFLQELAAELKRACGSGGTAGDGRVEIQGDHRDTLRARLAARGWRVKG